MPKSRHKRGFVGRKEERRLKERDAMEVAARVKILVGRLKNQDEYDAFLLQEPDASRRQTLYEWTRGFCKFSNPQFPSTLRHGGLVGPDGRPL